MIAMYFIFSRLFIQKHIVTPIVSLPSSQEEYIDFLNMPQEKKVFLKTTLNCKSGLFLIQRLKKAKKSHLGYFSFPCLIDSDLPRV